MARMIHPTTSCGNGMHHQSPMEEPVFHFTQKDGHHGLASLQEIRVWAEHIYENNIPHDEVYRELYVILPGGASLLPCTITFAGTAKAPKLVIAGTAAVSGVLYQETL